MERNPAVRHLPTISDEDQVRYRTATEHAFATLKRWIIAGILPPGSTIDQAELSQRLGMSRIPVRTALERLASERLISLTPRRSAVVTRLSIALLSSVRAAFCSACLSLEGCRSWLQVSIRFGSMARTMLAAIARTSLTGMGLSFRDAMSASWIALTST